MSKSVSKKTKNDKSVNKKSNIDKNTVNDDLPNINDDNELITNHSVPKDITPNREIIRVDQTPNKKAWAFVPLYKESVTGGLLFWQIGFDGYNMLERSHGYADGIINTDKKEVELNNSGRDMLEQALLEARNEYNMKRRKGYTPAGNISKALKEPMLADNFVDNKTGKMKPLNYPVVVQPKLDGIRLLVSQSSKNKFFIRSRRNVPWVHLDYLNEEFNSLFNYLPTGATIDGELYLHGMTFNKIQSIVMSAVNISPDLDKIQYHIFDIDYTDPDGATLEQRIELLTNVFDKYYEDKGEDFKHLVLVDSRVASNLDQVLSTHDFYVEEGYEGLMIKKLCNGAPIDSKNYTQSLYKAGRNSNTLKYKKFFDEEAIIEGVKEGKGRNKGVAIFIVRDKRGNVFDLEMRGTLEMRREFYQNIDDYIGKEVTFRYIKLNEYGVPVHYKGITIRE